MGLAYDYTASSDPTTARLLREAEQAVSEAERGGDWFAAQGALDALYDWLGASAWPTPGGKLAEAELDALRERLEAC